MEGTGTVGQAFGAGFVAFLVSMFFGSVGVAIFGGHTTAAGVHLGPDWGADMPVIFGVSVVIGLIAVIIVGLGVDIVDLFVAVIDGLFAVFR